MSLAPVQFGQSVAVISFVDLNSVMVSKMQVILIIRVCPKIDLLPCRTSLGCQSPSGFPSFLRPRRCPSSTFVRLSTLVLPAQADSTTHIHIQHQKAKLQNQLAKAAAAQNTILALYNATVSPIHAMTSISCLIISRSLLTIPSQSKQASLPVFSSFPAFHLLPSRV